MRLIEKRNQHRRDFTGAYGREGCGHKKTSYGYDDSYFHHQVIPDMKCPKCRESTNSLGLTAKPQATKYADWEVV